MGADKMKSVFIAFKFDEGRTQVTVVKREDHTVEDFLEDIADTLLGLDEAGATIIDMASYV